MLNGTTHIGFSRGTRHVAGGKMKTTGVGRWNPQNVGATNESGFSGQPGGYYSEYGDFLGQGSYGYWWNTMETDSDEASFQGFILLGWQSSRVSS